MNVGYDRNKHSDQFTFINTSGEWTNSQYHGSLMIRPIFRHQKNVLLATPELQSKIFKVYPNPASQLYTIDFGDLQGFDKISFTLYNAQGVKVMQSTFSGSNTLDVNSLASGFLMLLILAQENTHFAPVKLLIQH